MSEPTLAIGDTLRIDVEGCPPRVLNDYRFPRHANIVSFHKMYGAEYVTIGWPDGWQVGVKRDVANRMREAYLAENGGYVDIREATAKEVEILHQLWATQETERQQMLSMYPASEISGIPCAICGGDVIEFSIPNDIWNHVIRIDGKEHDKEYLCMACFFDALRVALGLKQKPTY